VLTHAWRLRLACQRMAAECSRKLFPPPPPTLPCALIRRMLTHTSPLLPTPVGTYPSVHHVPIMLHL
jgi:hypothetical protein